MKSHENPFRALVRVREFSLACVSNFGLDSPTEFCDCSICINPFLFDLQKFPHKWALTRIVSGYGSYQEQLEIRASYYSFLLNAVISLRVPLILRLGSPFSVLVNSKAGGRVYPNKETALSYLTPADETGGGVVRTLIFPSPPYCKPARSGRGARLVLSTDFRFQAVSSLDAFIVY